MPATSSSRLPITPRDFAIPLALAAVGTLGAIPSSRSPSDPIALLLWLSLISAPLGFACASFSPRHWTLAAIPPALWMALIAIVDGLSPRDLPSPAFAALAWTGLYAAGYGASRLLPRSHFSGVSALFLLTALLAALPILPGFLGQPWPPPLAARLLDLSPATLLAECAGLDWMHHPAIYAPAGAADIDPATRIAFTGSLAGPLAFVVGCALATLGEGIARSRART